MVDIGPNALKMTVKQVIDYINTIALVPFSRSERVSLAFGKWTTVETITALKLPFDPWLLGLCYLVCTERNISFLLAKTAIETDINQSGQVIILVFTGEHGGSTWRQLAMVSTLSEANAFICDLYAGFIKYQQEARDGAG